jgi:hypothetical protein
MSPEPRATPRNNNTIKCLMKTRLNLVSTLAGSVDEYLIHYIPIIFMYIFKDWLKIEVRGFVIRTRRKTEQFTKRIGSFIHGKILIPG